MGSQGSTGAGLCPRSWSSCYRVPCGMSAIKGPYRPRVGFLSKGYDPAHIQGYLKNTP